MYNVILVVTSQHHGWGIQHWSSLYNLYIYSPIYMYHCHGWNLKKKNSPKQRLACFRCFRFGRLLLFHHLKKWRSCGQQKNHGEWCNVGKLQQNLPPMRVGWTLAKKGRGCALKLTNKKPPFLRRVFGGESMLVFSPKLEQKMGNESTHFFILLARNKGFVRFYLLKFIMSWDFSSQQQPRT